MNKTRPVSLPVLFQACGPLRGKKAQVPGPPTVTSSPILKVISPASTQATSSLSRCKWERLLVPTGTVSSNSMMLSFVSWPRSFRAAKRPGAVMSRCFPQPAGTTRPFVASMLVTPSCRLRFFRPSRKPRFCFRAQSRFAKDQRQEQAYEGDREQDSERRQDGRESPGVDSITDQRAQEKEGGADSQLRHGDHGRAERGRDLLVERFQEEHTAQALADLDQDPEQDPGPTDERRHPEIRDDGQDADRGEHRSPAVSRSRDSGGSPGEARDKIVARPQDSEIGQGHPALLPVFLVRPDHHQPAGPPGDHIEDDEP